MSQDFWFSQLGGVPGTQWAEAREAAGHPLVCQAAPQYPYLTPNVSSAEGEKPHLQCSLRKKRLLFWRSSTDRKLGHHEPSSRAGGGAGLAFRESL